MSPATRPKGQVWLVGAGPGDPGLLTQKGAWCLARAEVVVHDRLANPRLLSLAPAVCEFIDVGKLPQNHPVPQDEINRILVDQAKQGRRVVRLKGGDPFVFGRGAEEALALVAEGIRFEVVPGISSAIAVPAYAGIPVTHRELCTSFQVITGHEKPGKSASGTDWGNLAQSHATLVILMGMANLDAICASLVDGGRDPATPVAIIQQGTLPAQQSITGTLADIAAKAREAVIEAPAVIVVGQVAALGRQLAWFGQGRLAGQRVIVTRSRDQASRLVELIEAESGEALEFPLIRTSAVEDFTALDAAMDRIADHAWLVFTSPNGVKYFFRRWSERRLDLRRLAGIKLCAIGEATAGELESLGLYPDLIPGEFSSQALAAELGPRLTPGDSVALARSDIAEPGLPEALRAAGARVSELIAYRTLATQEGRADLLEVLSQGRADWITFTSSSTVSNFVSLIGAENLGLLGRCKAVCIGPVTAEAARECGIPVHAVAATHTIAGLSALLGAQP